MEDQLNSSDATELYIEFHLFEYLPTAHVNREMRWVMPIRVTPSAMLIRMRFSFTHRIYDGYEVGLEEGIKATEILSQSINERFAHTTNRWLMIVHCDPTFRTESGRLTEETVASLCRRGIGLTYTDQAWDEEKMSACFNFSPIASASYTSSSLFHSTSRFSQSEVKSLSCSLLAKGLATSGRSRKMVPIPADATGAQYGTINDGTGGDMQNGVKVKDNKEETQLEVPSERCSLLPSSMETSAFRLVPANWDTDESEDGEDSEDSEADYNGFTATRKRRARPAVHQGPLTASASGVTCHHHTVSGQVTTVQASHLAIPKFDGGSGQTYTLAEDGRIWYSEQSRCNMR